MFGFFLQKIYLCDIQVNRLHVVFVRVRNRKFGGGKFFAKFFGQFGGNSYKNLSHLQKFAFSYTYDIL